jgi:hypothetical protein
VYELSSLKPHFGDHRMDNFNFMVGKIENKPYIKQNWMYFKKEKLLHLFSQSNWEIKSDNVQGC